jgi:calmodulin
MASTDRNEEQLEELRETFEYNDRDGDGSIELDEFKAMLEELESGMSAEEVRIGFRDIDANDDGLIDFDEFVAWWAQD